MKKDLRETVYTYTYRKVTLVVDGKLSLYFQDNQDISSITNNKKVTELYDYNKRIQFESYIDRLYREHNDDVVSVWRRIQLKNNWIVKLGNKIEKYNGAP